jgi:hypothetical protein
VKRGKSRDREIRRWGDRLREEGDTIREGMIRWLILCVMIVLMAVPVLGREPGPENRPVIAMSRDFQPFTFLNAEGKPAGMFVDIWRLWAQTDIHSGLLYSPERRDWVSGSQPFYEVGVSLFYLLSRGKIAGIGKLSGQTIAALRMNWPILKGDGYRTPQDDTSKPLTLSHQLRRKKHGWETTRPSE